MLRILSLFIILAFTCVVPAAAAEPPKDPILRIETGMHTTGISRIATDAAGRWLVTASGDKSLRVWELPSGRPFRTIRPPIGEGVEGRLNAVALSPDGATIAGGGWTQFNRGQSTVSSDGHTIYLFSRASGDLVAKITGMPRGTLHLAFSPDGRFLIVTLGGANGVRLYRTTDWSLAGEDRAYADRSESAHFSSDGRLVTTSWDGFVRLYDLASGSLNLAAKVKAPEGNQLFAARFSPDGSRVAVGYLDTGNISVLSGRDLSHIFSPDTSGVKDVDLKTVAWSVDGRYLFAGGAYHKQFDDGWKFIIRRWSDGGRGSYNDIAAAASDIWDLTPLPESRLAFGAADPAFGLLDQTGQRTLFVPPTIVDYRNDQEGFRVSGDGDTFGFGYELGGKSPATFDLTARSLSDGTVAPFLKAPIISTAGLNIEGWENTYEPKLNGAPLKIEQYEVPIGLAIAPNGNSFVLGTGWNLRRYNRQGNQLWEVPTPSIVRAVNIAGNGAVILAAYEDGTIRWYRMSDGKELLAFFPHADRKRWVLWTPSGYYDASPGGEELIGWHVNNGKDQAADFFPAAKFRSTYYRPDIVSRVLTTLSEDTAVAQANAEAGRKEAVAVTQILPPVVSILAPFDGATFSGAEIPLRFTLRTPEGSPVTAVKVLVDGRPVSQTRGIELKAKNSGEREVVAPLPPRDCEVTIIAENANAASVPATIRLKWGGQAAKAEEFAVQPKLYVLAIGVSDYADPSLKLGLAAKDARDFAAALAAQKGLLYRDVVTKVLTDREATRDDVVDGLDWLVKETTSKDVAMLFLAGHGVNDPSGIYYYLPQNTDLEKLRRTGVPFSDIKNTLASIAGKTLFFVDTCHSGNVMGARRSVADINAVVNELSSAENGAVVFASSSGRQYSLEDPKWGNGAFTKALIEGIGGKADYTGKGRITVNMLDLYLSERVKELTRGKQTPTTTKPHTVPDFPLAVRK